MYNNINCIYLCVFVCMTKECMWGSSMLLILINIHTYIHTCVDSGLSQNFASLSLHSPLVFNNSAALADDHTDIFIQVGPRILYFLTDLLHTYIHTYVRIVNISYVYVIIGWLHFYFSYIHTYIRTYIQTYIQCLICAKFIYT